MMATVIDDVGDTSNILTDETAAIIASFDPNVLVGYLTNLAVMILDASRDDLQVSLLGYPDTLQRCAKFAADPNSAALYMQKDLGEASTQNGNSTYYFRGIVNFFRGYSNAIRLLHY